MTDADKLFIQKLPRVCPKCSKVVLSGNCQCGYKFADGNGGTGGGSKQIEIDAAGKLERVESRVYIYPTTTGDLAKDAFVGRAEANGYHPGWIAHQTKDLELARAAYRQAFRSEPKSHWKSQQIRAIINSASQNNSQTVSA